MIFKNNAPFQGTPSKEPLKESLAAPLEETSQGPSSCRAVSTGASGNQIAWQAASEWPCVVLRLWGFAGFRVYGFRFRDLGV